MGKSLLDFQEFSEKESAHYYADHLPKGRAFGRKHDGKSIAYKTCIVLGNLTRIFSGDLLNFLKNKFVIDADDLLPELEYSVGIPAQIPRRDTIAGRNEAVRCLLSRTPVYNIDDGIVDDKTTFERYVKCLTGIEITIRTARVGGIGSQFPLIFPFEFGSVASLGGLKLIIEVPVIGDSANNTFPLMFPVQFFDARVPDATIDLLDKILDRVVPLFMRWEYEAVIV